MFLNVVSPVNLIATLLSETLLLLSSICSLFCLFSLDTFTSKLPFHPAMKVNGRVDILLSFLIALMAVNAFFSISLRIISFGVPEKGLLRLKSYWVGSSSVSLQCCRQIGFPVVFIFGLLSGFSAILTLG